MSIIPKKLIFVLNKDNEINILYSIFRKVFVRYVTVL